MKTEKEFTRTLCQNLPLHEALVDAQLRGMKQVLLGDFRKRGRWDLWLRFTLDYVWKRNELRENVKNQLANSLHSFAYVACGDAFYYHMDTKGEVTPGKKFLLTQQNVFLPNVKRGLLFRLWNVREPDKMLAHIYDWYAYGVCDHPELFRRREWELVVDEDGDLAIRLTGELCEKQEHDPSWKRATVFCPGDTNSEQ